ncbi:MAG: DUF2062 domain-containing protein [Proteobacteria bacterium]|nr:DUF2062 domain-containing protein [Pseudomonadota bacterium]MDA1308459.1 DUF2062 domain-containing protein [Pseudomonadota bacterium]
MYRSLLRMLRYRLLIPIKRGQNPPIVTARGVLVGMVCAMTPLVGIQMAMVALVWAVQRVVAPDWRFSVIVAMAMTWVSNVFTLPPIYYLFLVTGRIMLGHWEESLGFGVFAGKLDEILSIDGGGLTAAWEITLAMVELWGLPMFLGCVPWAALCGWLGYLWSLRFVTRRRQAMQERLLRRQQAGTAADIK